MPKDHAPSHRLAAILFSDIVGFTSLMGQDEQKALQFLRQNREIHKKAIENNNGKWLKEMGDGILAKFKSAYDAVKCALNIQEDTAKQFDYQIRIGIHLGDITMENADVFGDGVNIASRLQSIADPGGIYISESVYKATKSNIDIRADFLGYINLKNVDQPVGTYFLMADFLSEPTPGKKKELTQTDSNPNKRRKTSLVLFILILVFSGIIYTGFLYFGNYLGVRALKTLSLVVLPLDNLSGDPDQEYFSDAMTEALIANLSKIGALTVISRTTAMRYKHSELSLPEIAKELNVDIVIEGSVIREGEMVRITAQLIDSKSDKHLWANSYDRDLTNILVLQSEVAQAIAGEIEITITPEEKVLLATTRKVNPEAYEAYLKGQFHLFKLTPDNYDIALGYYEKAIAIDPDYAQPYAGIARVWSHRGLWGGDRPDDSMAKSLIALNKAKKLDNRMADLEQIQACIHYCYDFDYVASETSFQKALSLDPNNVEAHLFYGDFLLSMKRFDEALYHLKKGMALDPMNSFSFCMIGWGYLVTGHEEEALINLEKSVEMSYDLSLSLRCLWTLSDLHGLKDQALIYAARFYQSQGMGIAAEEIAEKKKELSYEETLISAANVLVEESKARYIPSMRIARLYTMANEEELALDFLEKSLEEKFASNFAVNIDPHWSRLRDMPRFQAILQKMKLP